VFASVLVGWLLHRYTQRRLLLSSAIFQCAALLALLLPVLGYTDLLSVGLAIGLFYFAFTAITTVLMTLMTNHASMTDFHPEKIQEGAYR